MPVSMRKLPGQNKWRVYDGDRIVAKGTTKTKAEKQMRLLNGLAHGMQLRKKG